MSGDALLCEPATHGQGFAMPPGTDHAAQRSARRGLSPEAIAYVLSHGTLVQRTGVDFVVLRRRDMPRPDLRTSAAKLEGTVLVISRSGAIVTAYRAQKESAYRRVQKKLKSRRFD